MFRHSRTLFLRLLIIVAAAFLLAQLPGKSEAVSPAVVDHEISLLMVASPAAGAPLQQTEGANPAVPTACPLNNPPYTAGLEIIERTDFCLYYEEGVTSDYANGILSAADAIIAADHVEDYWDRYAVDFGFEEPFILAPNTKLEVLVEGGGSCNGATNSTWNYMYSYTECYGNAESIQKVLGHELFHRVQYSYDGSEVKWFKEGTARAMEDLAFTNIDNWATTLTAVSSSFNKQVNTYLSGTTANEDITSDNQRYNSALWWKYFTEQYGSTPGEPQLGVDAFLALWEAAETSDDLAALNSALAALGASDNFNDAFRQFAVANWTKDLTGVPDDSYNYADEDQVGNGAPYGPLVPTNGGTITTATTAVWNNQWVDRYGLRYYQATPGADCPAISATFHQDEGPDAFYHVITQIGSAFQTHVEGSGTDWTQNFLNNGITKVVAIIGGQDSDATIDIEIGCVDPVIDIEIPNQLAPAYVGNSGSPDDIILQVSVTDGSPTGPVVGGIANSDFKVEIGGDPALVVGGGFVQEEYFLRVDTPTQGANGPYDLEVFLEEPGTTTVIASDTETDAVVYDNTNIDHIIITDVSYSMNDDGKLIAAADAAHLYIDVSNSSDGLGLVSFSTDVEDFLDVEFGTLGHRNDAHDQVDSYVPTLATSIGDGLDKAVDLLNASPTGNTRCQFTLLSDGMENRDLYWADVEGDVKDTDCPVMTVAFGEASNELLMQEIATETGGASYYNDVYVSNQDGGGGIDQTELELGNSYMHAFCEGRGCERLYSVQGEIGYAEPISHSFGVDSSVLDLTVVLDWYPSYVIPLEGETPMSVYLQSPSGVTYTPQSPEYFYDGSAGFAGYRIDNANIESGEWSVVVLSFFDDNDKPYQVMAFGRTPVTADLLLPAGFLATGQYFPLYAIWRPGGQVMVRVTAMDGTANTMFLHDDGQHGDGRAGDGFFAGLYTLVNQAEIVQPVDEQGVPSPPALDEGAYRVDMLATDGELRRETRGSFSVEAGEETVVPGVPDDFIETHCPAAPNSDNDLDQLSCADEYYVGTDPNNSDTDGGGENDGSEVNMGQDPLDPSDDLIVAPEFLKTTNQNSSVLVEYDVQPEYEQIALYRANSADGPYSLLVSELPLDGSFDDDSANNGESYWYRMVGRDSDGHWSAIPTSTEANPSEDPYPPEAQVLINGGAPSTNSRNVVLSFIPYEDTMEELAEVFDDIVEMKISNDPSFAGADWQPFEQDVPWVLPNTPGMVSVYVMFRDDFGNESIGPAVGMILYNPDLLFLPIMLRQP